MKLALLLSFVSATSVTAAPYYVGENMGQPNHIGLGFQDTPSKDGNGRANSGNIASIDLRANYNLGNGLTTRMNLPFYFANKDATTAGTSRNAMGNFSLGGGWMQTLQTTDRTMTYGYGIAADIYAGTSRKDESTTVALANPTTDLYRYYARTWSATPMVSVFVKSDAFSARTAFGAGLMKVQKKSNLPSDTNRIAINWQNAVTWHAMPNVNANLEYNTTSLDTATRGTRAKFRHALTPSVNGTFNQVMASAFVTVPLDAPTRDYTTVAFGLNAGYTF